MGWNDEQYKSIMNRELESVEVIEDGAAVRFTFLDTGTVIYDAYGDCCSHSWIEHLSVPLDIYGQRILKITEPELPPHPASNPIPEQAEYGEDIKVYHTAFATNVGHIVLEYRNSSNGYYGGSLEGPRGGA